MCQAAVDVFLQVSLVGLLGDCQLPAFYSLLHSWMKRKSSRRVGSQEFSGGRPNGNLPSMDNPPLSNSLFHWLVHLFTLLSVSLFSSRWSKQGMNFQDGCPLSKVTFEYFMLQNTST